MAIHTTYSNARANLARLCNKATEDKEIIFINRRHADGVALIATSELSSLLETAHLLRSPKNSQRLLTALKRAISQTEIPQSIKDFRREIGLDEER
jgi:antitoxin YefM